MKDQYVLLTGAKNNAGDFLIRQRGIQLLSRLRPDRELVVLDAWKPLDDSHLTIINESRALILMGGPAIQPRMSGGVYALCADLDMVHAPIVTLGVGWKSSSGNWGDTRSYPFSEATFKLLRKVKESGLISSVRDWHTLNVLQYYGFDNFVMTGCPALFKEGAIEHRLSPNATRKPVSVSFSLGVSHVGNERMGAEMKSVLSALVDYFGRENVTAVFHHSINPEAASVYGKDLNDFFSAHQRFSTWLDQMQIKSVDISGDAHGMEKHYSETDLHVGYRVHAHILRVSMNMPSILIAEDGRGRALQALLGGSVVCCEGARSPVPKLTRLLPKIVASSSRLWRRRCSSSATEEAVSSDVMHIVENEVRHGFPRSRHAIAVKNEMYGDMKKFVLALP